MPCGLKYKPCVVLGMPYVSGMPCRYNKCLYISIDNMHIGIHIYIYVCIHTGEYVYIYIYKQI